MNFPLKKITFSILTMLIAVTAFASQAQADIYGHIDRMALDIQTKSRLLLRETVHYRYTPQYRKIVTCTMNLRRHATHIHEVTHFEGNLDHLAADLRDLDQEYHQLEDLFDRVEHTAARGCATIAGHTAHVKRLLNAIEDCIHQLQDDVNELRRLARRVRRVTPVYTQQVFVPTRPSCPSTRGYAPVPRQSFNINYSQIQGYGNRGRGNFDRGHGNTRINERDHRDRGHGHRELDRRQTSNRGNSGYNFSIGGGSSQLHFRF